MSSTNGDILRLHQSTTVDRLGFAVEEKQYLDVTDVNNLNYSGGTIQFDGNTIKSNADFTDWQSSYLTIPVTFDLDCDSIVVPTAAAAEDFTNDLAFSLKNGNIQIINGMTIICENQTLVNFQQMSNIPQHFKLLTSWNENDQQVYGPSVGFWKDTSDSFFLNSSLGECNNDITNNGEDAREQGEFFNRGRRERIMKTIYPGRTNANPFYDLAGLKTKRANHITTSASGKKLRVELMITIPFVHLHDIFRNIPLQKMALWQFTFHTHLPCVHTLSWSAATDGTVPTVKTDGTGMTLQSPNDFCPFMLSVPYTATGGGTGTDAKNGLFLGASSASPGFFTAKMTIGNEYQQSCEMSICQVRLSAATRATYLGQPVKPIVYEDFLHVQNSGLTKIPAVTGQVNVNITNGQQRPRGILIFPYATYGAGPTSAGEKNMSPLASPYSTCGATTSPHAPLLNFNVSVGNRNLFRKNLDYGYHHFLREMYGTNAVNGNLIPGCRTGMINFHDWNNGYGFVYVNLERHRQEDDDLSTGIDLTFKNGSNRIMSYRVFLFYEREVYLNVENGQLKT